MNLIVIVMMMWSCSVLLSQETWKKTYGGGGSESCSSIITTPDGGLVLTGSTLSNDGDFEEMNKGVGDIFVIKLDSRGDVQWKKTFGGSNYEWGYSITTTPDGGFVLTGSTLSNDGDFNGMNKGLEDIFVIKLDSQGNILWKKTFGGSNYEWGYSITTTPDGGFVLTGSTLSNDGDFEEMNKGVGDIFVIKIDSRGDVQWKKTFGGTTSGLDEGWSITTTPDSGLVLTGSTSSNDDDFNGMNKGLEDIFVIKLDSQGNILWKKTFGGSNYEWGYSITTTPDGGSALSGYTRSNNADFNGMNKGLWDIFVIKLDSRGDVQWKKIFGGSDNDWGLSITTTPDGGFVLTGSTLSNDGDFQGMNKGSSDIFVIKLDSNGNLNPPTSIDVHSDILSSFDITPNPLSSFSTISYSLDKPSNVRIEVVNSIGEVVFVLSDKQEDVGSQQVSFNTTDLVTGTYSIRLIENNRVTSKRVIQMK